MALFVWSHNLDARGGTLLKLMITLLFKVATTYLDYEEDYIIEESQFSRF